MLFTVHHWLEVLCPRIMYIFISCVAASCHVQIYSCRCTLQLLYPETCHYNSAAVLMPSWPSSLHHPNVLMCCILAKPIVYLAMIHVHLCVCWGFSSLSRILSAAQILWQLPQRVKYFPPDLTALLFVINGQMINSLMQASLNELVFHY